MRVQDLWPRFLEIFDDVSRDLGRGLSLVFRRSKSISRTPTYSWGRSDYLFWTKAYFCKVVGLEVSGLFIRPIVHKIPAWVLGNLPTFIMAGKTAQKRLDKWFSAHHEDILRAYEGSLKHGDAFFVINSDLSITLVPPDTVDPIVDENDYGKQIGWRIRQIFPHPDDGSRKMIVTDEYFADRRVHTEEFSDNNTKRRIFPNLIGVVPVIHIANHPGEGEQFGHPEAEALLDLLHRYGQILEASVEGNILQGRPTPVISFQTVQDLNAFWRRYGNKTATSLPDGTTREAESISIDMSDVLTLSGASFSYESPGSFAQDAEKILGLLFYLIIEHLEVPEFVFGNAIEGSKASAETQMPVFEVFITARQKSCTPWILQTVKVFRGYDSVVNVGTDKEDPLLQWKKLTQNGRMVLDTVKWAYTEGLLDEKTALILLPIDIADPVGVLKQAKKDAEERKALELAQAEEQLKMQVANTPAPAEPKAGTPKALSQAREMDESLKEELETLNI